LGALPAGNQVVAIADAHATQAAAALSRTLTTF
jgi:hypothetical protein